MMTREEIRFTAFVQAIETDLARLNCNMEPLSLNDIIERARTIESYIVEPYETPDLFDVVPF